MKRDGIIYADVPGFNDKSYLNGQKSDSLCIKLGINEFMKIVGKNKIQKVICMTQFFQLYNRSDGVSIGPLLEFVYEMTEKEDNGNIDLSSFIFIFTHPK